MNFIFKYLFFIGFFIQNDPTSFLVDKNDLKFFFSHNDSIYLISSNIIYKNFSYYDSIISDGSDLNDINYKNFDVVTSDSDIFFVEKSLGRVFTLKDNSIKRIDNSSTFNSHYNSAKITYDNTLYSFFGYGHYIYNNNFLTFDAQGYKGWVKNYPNNTYYPAVRSKPFFHKYDNKIYFLSGEYQLKPLQDVFEFNFYNNTFKYLGNIPNAFMFDLSKQNHTNQLKINDSLIIINTGVSVNLIDFKNFNYKQTSIPSNNQSNPYPMLILNENLYFLRETNTNDLRVDSYNLSNYINEGPEQYKPLIEKQKINPFIVILSFVVLFIIYKLIKLNAFKSKFILKQKNYITFKNQLIILNYEENEIFNLLLTKNKCAYNDFISLESFEEYSINYKISQINKAIRSIEKKIQNIDSLKIISKKTKIDKRINTYTLKGNVKEYNGWFNYIFSF